MALLLLDETNHACSQGRSTACQKRLLPSHSCKEHPFAERLTGNTHTFVLAERLTGNTHTFVLAERLTGNTHTSVLAERLTGDTHTSVLAGHFFSGGSPRTLHIASSG